MNSALRTQRALTLWVLLGLLSFVLLPWYFLQQGSLWSALPHIWGGSETASALLQVLQHDRPWLWLGFAGLFICLVGLIIPVLAQPKRQGFFGSRRHAGFDWFDGQWVCNRRIGLVI